MNRAAKTAKHVDITRMPELVRLAREVQRTGQARVLTRDREVLAVLEPVPPTPPAARPRARRTGPDDPYWELVGLGQSDGPADVSAEKYRHLAEAYAPREP
jgi:hypothetical protein